MPDTIQDQILDALVARFEAVEPANYHSWERVEKYAIDDAARMKKAAIGMVDQGQKYNFKVSLMDMRWRMAFEFCVRSNVGEDIQKAVNHARADIVRTLLKDVTLDGLTVDMSPDVDEVFVDRGDNYGEGVVVFEIRYRAQVDDLAIGM